MSEPREIGLERALHAVRCEVLRAEAKFRPFNSAHEGAAVLRIDIDHARSLLPLTRCQHYALSLIEVGYKAAVACLAPKSTIQSLWVRKLIDHTLDLTPLGDKVLALERAERMGYGLETMGKDGIRDPQNPCELFTKEPAGGLVRDCEGDGHYLCETCVLYMQYEEPDIPKGH